MEAAPEDENGTEENDEGLIYKSDPKWVNTTSNWLKVSNDFIKIYYKTINACTLQKHPKIND